MGHVNPKLQTDPNARAAPYAPYLLSALLAMAVVAAGAGAYRYYVSQREALKREVRNELLAIADIKMAQLSEWRRERIGDGEAIAADSMTNSALRRFLAGPQKVSDRARILAWMEAVCRHAPYTNAILTDAGGRVFLSFGERMGDGEHLRRSAIEGVAAGRIVLRDFQREGPNGPIHLGVIVPLRTAPDEPPFGTMLLGIDPADRVYPLLNRWPIPSASAETLLVRRDGDSVLYLSELRHRAGSAMTLRVPLSNKSLPAAQAISGVMGDTEGLDYRGVRVFAAVRRVPYSPWFLIAKIDADEVLAPMARRSAMAGLAALGFVLAAIAGGAFFWRRQQLRFYRDRYRAELERRALLGH
jgi:hypothetical protein